MTLLPQRVGPVVDRVVANVDRYKQIKTRAPLCFEFSAAGSTLLLVTPVHLYAFDATTFDNLCFEDSSRVREPKVPHSTFVIQADDAAAAAASSSSFIAAPRKLSGPPMMRIVPQGHASDRAIPYLSLLHLSSAWVQRGDSSTAVLKFSDPVDSESEQTKNSMSRVRIAPKVSPEGAELHIQLMDPSSRHPCPQAAARFVEQVTEFLGQFSMRRARPVDLLPELTSEWAEDVKALARSGRSMTAKSFARTDRSKARTLVGNDTWGSRKNALLLRDVLSGEWGTLLEIRFDAENAPSDGRWDPLLDAIRARIVPQEYIDDARYRPVRLQFESVDDLTADLLGRFFDAVESNFMRVISVSISGFCPKFGHAGLQRLLGYVERDTSCVTTCTIAGSVLESEAVVDPVARDRSQRVLDNIARQVSRAAMVRKRFPSVSP